MRGELNDCSYITTFSGRNFWPLEPREEDVYLEDIAHALANQCRWTGHVREFMSIAQHAYLASFEVSPEFAFTTLHHDDSEAYLVDLARPIKHAPGLGEIYLRVEAEIEKVIAKKFGTIYPLPPEVKAADNKMLWSEKRDLMQGSERDLDSNLVLAGSANFLSFKIDPWLPKQAEKAYLQRHYELGGK